MHHFALQNECFIGGKYEVPGGRKEFGETDDEALKREIKEEVGLEIKIQELLNEWSLDLKEKGIHLDGKTYLCESNSDNVILSDKHLNYKWIERKELENLDCPNWLKDAISKL
ncbi:MAG: NUDIX domain-containing protein [Candidatus Aenigmarchaeota archaeon]|nr:NUDIX domain-containing protein [Candidatus Aenigmarchaeota archaeon]